jgi:predicted ATPase
MKVMSIHGLGGVGKTQLALNYANTSLKLFEVIVWVPSGTQIKMTQALSAFAKKIGLNVPKADETEDNSQAAQKVRDWLNMSNNNFLLVFDNVEASDLLLQVWPSSSKGSILITTRSSSVAWKRATDVIHLQSFPRHLGMNTLTTLTGISPSDEHELEAAGKIVDLLGGLPLAIVQISDFIRDRSYSYSEFLPLYQSSASKIIARGETTMEYNHTLRTVWDLSLQELSGDARTLQQLLSFLEPDKIEEKMMTNPGSGLTKTRFDFLRDEFE